MEHIYGKLREEIEARIKRFDKTAKALVEPCLISPNQFEDNIYSNKVSVQIVREMLNDFINDNIEETPSAIELWFKRLGSKYSVKLKYAVQPFRIAITGRNVGLPLFELINYIGIDESKNRIRYFLERVDNV